MAGVGQSWLILLAAWLCVSHTETSSSRAVGHVDASAASTCRVSGEYYTTFDGVGFYFTGSCTYVLAKVCDSDRELPDFTVEVLSDGRSNSSSPAVQQVTVALRGLRVTLLRGDRRGGLVNGIWTDIPLSLDGDAVKIQAQGPSVVLQTSFNLSVSFTRSGIVQVTAPAPYAGKLCGLCGRSLSDKSNGDSWARGWSLRSTGGACAERPLPVTCSEAKWAAYGGEAFCGVLLSRTGPFSRCSAAQDPAGLFQRCVSEMCATRGNPDTLCEVLQDSADICAEAGFPVTGWRNSTSCAAVCGVHGHLAVCSGACPATCSSWDAPEDCGSCAERCECDQGFLLSGGKCVAAEDCGCWADGEYYEKGQVFMQADCGKQCVCVGHDVIRCSATSCPDGEVCGVKDEVSGCFPSSPVTCSVYGDPHYITFDGKAYSFQGSCNYTLAKTCGASKVAFTLTARNERPGGSASTSLNSVALNMDGLHLTVRKNKLIYVNGGHVSLPYSHNSSVNVSQNGPYVQVDTSFGLRVLFDGNERVFVQVDERHKGRMCGLCGTYSGSQFDDFLTPNGTVVPYPHDFASSWNTHDQDWVCREDYPDDTPCSPELDSEAYEECSKLFGDAFRACHWFVPPQIFVNSCVRDHCSSAGDPTRLCASLRSYAAACEVAEVALGDWWLDTICANVSSISTTSDPTTSSPTAGCSWSCNFDQDECGWEQLIQDSFNWTRWSGPTPSEFTGPTNDHTTGRGFYMYIEGDGMHRGDSARMISPECRTSGSHCISFWYHMYGAHAVMLNIYQLERNHATKIWSRANNQGNQWHNAQLEVHSEGPFQVIVEGIRGSDARSDVAWDDITVTQGKCGVSSFSPKPPGTSLDLPLQTSVCRINCNFDSDLCSWTQLPTDVFDWTRQSGSTPTAMTGPSFDHTTGRGHYVYIEGDSASHGDTARLLSEDCADRQPQCLQFWYHMYGSSWTMGLTVYLLHGNVAQEIWRRREDQGNTWRRALVDFTPQHNFKIIFEGRRGHSAKSDVAVDDVSLHRGYCSDLINDITKAPDWSTETTTGQAETTVIPVWSTAIPAQTTVVPVWSTAIPAQTDPGYTAISSGCTINCNFDSNLCSWSQLATDVFDWTRQSGSTPTAMTGPSFDHTTGRGHYVYIEGDSASHGDTARLLSEDCADRQPQCLQFWYHMYGSSWTMGLTVYLLHGNVAQEIWRRREDQGNTWRRALVDFTPQHNFKIIFEGRRGHSAKSDVAVDDVSLHRGYCSDLINDITKAPDWSTETTTGQAETTVIPVWSTAIPAQTTVVPVWSTAIPAQTDPGYTAISSGCTINCNFDSNLCSWSQLATDVFDWTRQSGSTPTAMTGPSFDHTTGRGHYVYIEGDSASHGDTARLLSEDCADRQPQCLQFWYHMYGSSWTMGLTVYLLHGNVAQEIWRRREDQGNTWRRALVDFTPQHNFKIIFEGRRGHSAKSDVAVDDVSLHRGYCSDLINDITKAPDWSTETTTGQAETTVIPVWSTAIPAQTTVVPVWSTAIPAQTDPGYTAISSGCTINCNFDSNLCSWSQLATDVFDWTRQSGSTPTAMTGPSFDHTTGRGHYVYIEGDSASHGDTARLLSEDCADRQPQCLQFWYHMYGSSWTMGLTVYLLHGNVAQEIWRRREDQGNTWRRALVDFTPQHNFKIIFEGRRGHSAKSDVAVDDVSLHRGYCSDLINDITKAPDWSTETTTGQAETTVIPVWSTAIPAQTTVVPVWSTAIPAQTDPGYTAISSGCTINCNFDSNLCSWSQLATDVFDWTRQSGSTPTAMTGPSFDHTTGRGHYVYIEGDSASHGDTARLLSEDCADRQPQCLQFWYHMYGSSWTMGLTVYLLHGNVAQEIWRRREDQGNTWRRALVDFTPQHNFKIIFEGRRGHSAKSDVAVDDVSLHRGTCSDLINDVTASPSHEGLTVPMETTDTPVENTVAPAQTTAAPVETTAAPPKTTAESFLTSGLPVETTASSVETTEGSVETTAAPAETTVTSAQTTAAPVETTAAPVETTVAPVETTAVPVETTEGSVETTPVPVETTVAPVETTAVPVETTEGSVETTAAPVETTAVPVETTEGSVETTAAPVETTAAPVETTAVPVETTEGSVETTAAPVETTAVPVETTEGSVENTAAPVETTAVPVETTEGSVETTAAPVETTAAPVETTDASAETTVTSAQTTVVPVETTAALETTTQPNFSCPVNSYPTACMPACQPTCDHLQGAPECSTAGPCVPGCVCEDGFVLRLQECVPVQSCGCTDETGDSHSFGETWYSAHCTRRCECRETASGGQLSCSEHACGDDSVCLADELGEYRCRPTDFSECSIEDDPEYRTFDDLKHKFKGKHSYVLVRSTDLPNNIPEVHIVGINKKIKNLEDTEEDHNDEDVSSRGRHDDDDDDDSSSSEEDGDGRVRALRVQVYRRTVELREGRDVLVDGVKVKTPVFPATGLKIREHSSRLYLETDFGLSVEFNGRGKAEITLPHVYMRKVGGLCGNLDGQKKNDMMKPDGSQAKNLNEFGESWRV